MKLPALFQVRVLKTALKALFSAPFTTSFPRKAYTPVEQFRGRPRYDEEACIGCGACAEVCPAVCIDQVDDVGVQPPVRRFVQHLDACICCGQCERYCTTEKGIRMSNEYDFVGFAPEDFEEKVEKELLLCEGCGSVTAPLDQIRWLVDRLGPMAFCNPTLMLVSHRELEVVDPGVARADGDVTRAQRVAIQCPRCRRKTALTV